MRGLRPPATIASCGTLWFTFRDVYWEREGRLSIDAVVLFGSLLSIAMWGGPFFRDVVRLWSRVP